MIPYEELVVALQTWRARQGLPVTQLSGSLTPPPSGRPAAPPPPKPSAPPAPPAKAAAPPPLAPPPEDSLDVEDAALLDDGHYEAENFTMKFGSDVEADPESTNIQSEPATRASDGFGGLTDPNPLAGVGHETDTVELPDPKHPVRSTNRNDDW